MATRKKELAHAVLGGFMGMVRETSKEVVAGNMQDLTWQNILINQATYFKDYFLGDMIMNFTEYRLKGFSFISFMISGPSCSSV